MSRSPNTAALGEALCSCGGLPAALAPVVAAIKLVIFAPSRSSAMSRWHKPQRPGPERVGAPGPTPDPAPVGSSEGLRRDDRFAMAGEPVAVHLDLAEIDARSQNAEHGRVLDARGRVCRMVATTDLKRGKSAGRPPIGRPTHEVHRVHPGLSRFPRRAPAPTLTSLRVRSSFEMRTRTSCSDISGMALKTERLSLRLTPKQDAVLRRAAEARGESTNDFVLRHAVEAAESELADRRVFFVDDAEWEQLRCRFRLHPRFRPRWPSCSRILRCSSNLLSGLRRSGARGR